MVPQPSSRYGYTPTEPAPKQLTKRKIAEQKQLERLLFRCVFMENVPDWWPRHATNGEPQTHVYRVIDEWYGSDLVRPPQVVSQLLPDFRNLKYLRMLMYHCSPESAAGKKTGDDNSDRPFLSTSADILCSNTWVDLKRKRALKKGWTEMALPIEIVMIDITAMFRDGWINEHSFADLRCPERFDQVTRPIRTTADDDWLNERKIDI